jgi:pyruvate/2-oxoglutarate dehydrogenase complex dihydrolipoamide dehydrogenase (E3) component
LNHRILLGLKLAGENHMQVIKQISVVGGGMIAVSLASQFQTRGMEVVVVEPRSSLPVVMLAFCSAI